MTFIDALEGRYGNSYCREFREAINAYAPNASRFLEWGSGETTRILCDIALTKHDPFVLSIDDNKEYLDAVAKSLPQYPFLHLRCLDLQGPSFSQEDQYPSYASYPFFIGMEFDVAFVDGRRRAECALTAAQVVAETGVIIVHDWRRSRYAPTRALFDTLHEGPQFIVLRPRPINRRPKRRNEERRVIIVPANGAPALRELEISRPYAEAYAKTVGADFVVVGQSSKLPPQRIKAAALEIAESYDRTLLLDADVLIRPGAPDIFDIVPDGSLGAFEEGRFFPREEWCRTLNQVYNLGGALTPENYFNSGVMVLSRSNLALLKALRDEVMWGHPQFDQGFLNAKRVAFNMPLFSLPYDFNYIPNGTAPNDWRYSFFFHLAGSPKERPNPSEIWTDETGDLETFSLRPYRAQHIRLGLLRQAADQFEGRQVRIFDPFDFQYDLKRARPICDRDGGAVVFFPPHINDTDYSPAVWGPYIQIDRGWWRLELLQRDGKSLFHWDEEFDIVKDIGVTNIVQRTKWPSIGAIKFHIEERVENVEFRLYRSGRHTGSQNCANLAMWRLEWLGSDA